jgi:putative ABC transport system substrate-binding protein
MLAKTILAFTVVTTLLSATALFAAEPPRSGHVYRVGWLSGAGGRPWDADTLKAFRSGMADLGWDGTSTELVERWANARPERLPGLAAELVALNVDVIVAIGDASVLAAMRATRQIPIVSPFSEDPVGAKLVTSLARPGGNVTGLSYMGPEIYAKELSLLKEAMPGLRKLGVVINSASPSADGIIGALRNTSGALGIELKIVDAYPLDSLDLRINEMTGAGVQAITGFVLKPPFKDRLIRFGTANRIPLAGYTDGLPGLLSLEVDELQMARRSARYVDKILRGANPGELAVEQPTKFLLFINLTTAKAYGITIPQSLLLQADNIIQ